MPPSSPCSIVVAGDVVVDRHFYAGERYSMTARAGRGVREVAEQGGAHLLRCVIDSVFSAYAKRSSVDHSAWAVHLAVDPMPLDAGPTRLEEGYALWEPYPLSRDNNQRVWRVSRMMGYSDLRPEAADALRPPPLRPVPEPDLQVIDDAGFLFRHAIDRPVERLAE